MQVKVHPHKTMVNAGIEACVSVTPDQRYGRAHYSGTVVLRDVEFRIHQSGVKRARAEGQRNVHAWAVGYLLGESPIQLEPEHKSSLVQVTYHYQIGHFITHDGTIVDDGHFDAAYFCGRDFYVSRF